MVDQAMQALEPTDTLCKSSSAKRAAEDRLRVSFHVDPTKGGTVLDGCRVVPLVKLLRKSNKRSRFKLMASLAQRQNKL
jgi:hypothetical protein